MTLARAGAALAVALAVALAAAACRGGEPGTSPWVLPPVERAAMLDTMDPGTMTRAGPASAEHRANPPSAPTVRADSVSVVLHSGFFIPPPCMGPGVDAAFAGDTIVVRVRPQPLIANCEPATADTFPYGYITRIGPIPVGEYAVRVIHEGDLARAPLDTVFPRVTVDLTRRR